MKSLYVIVGTCVAIAGLFLVSGGGAQGQGEKRSPVKKAVTAPAKEAESDRPDDRAAIEAVNAEFTRAFDAGDAQALAALFTEDARMSDEAGKTVEGRTAIQAKLVEVFRDAPGTKIVLKTDSVKFLSPDVAVEEGSSQLRPADAGEETDAEFTPYTAIFVKQDGKWLHSVVRDYIVSKDDDAAADTSHAEHLKELEWMVGEWVEEGSESRSISQCRWAQNNNFLVWDYTVEKDRAHAPGGTSYIGWDSLTGQIKSWVFDANGGHGEATWTPHGDGQWVVKASGVLSDGRIASATQYVTRLGNDRAAWTSVDRVAGGEVQPDISEYIIVRKPPTPGAQNKSSKSN